MAIHGKKKHIRINVQITTTKQQTAVQITSTNQQSAVQGQKMKLSVPQEPTGETDRSTFFHSKIIKKKSSK